MTVTVTLSRGLVAVIDDEDLEIVAKHKWYAGTNGYAKSAVMVDGKLTRFIMHRLIMGAARGQTIDHVNGDKLDNRRKNLRFCSLSENQQNKKRRSDSKSPYKGVSVICRAGIQVNGKFVNLGHFDTPEEAALAYDAAARHYFGKFARCNFPFAEGKSLNHSPRGDTNGNQHPQALLLSSSVKQKDEPRCQPIEPQNRRFKPSREFLAS